VHRGPIKTLSPIFSGYGACVPRDRREGGRSSVDGAMMVFLPMLIAVELGFDAAAADEDVEVLVVVEEEDSVRGRARSPRSTVSDMSTVLPARVMFCVPEMCARRETLLPESLAG
jgi:hypothetical protein